MACFSPVFLLQNDFSRVGGGGEDRVGQGVVGQGGGVGGVIEHHFSKLVGSSVASLFSNAKRKCNVFPFFSVALSSRFLL